MQEKKEAIKAKIKAIKDPVVVETLKFFKGSKVVSVGTKEDHEQVLSKALS